MYLNKAFIFGNLTRDPELKALPSGTSVATFSLATNRVWNDKDGTRREDTDYHNIVVFGRQAETVSQYLRKGSSALVEGRITTRSWDADDGSKRYRTEIIADRIQFGPRTGGGPMNGGGASTQTASSTSSDDISRGSQIEYPQEDINPEDIPF